MTQRLAFILALVLAIALGCAVGQIFGKDAAVLGVPALGFIQLLKTLASPLIFFAVLDAFARTHIPPRKGAQLLVISVTNAVVAGGIALLISALSSHWPIALHGLSSEVSLPTTKPHSGALWNNVLLVIGLAILVGSALRLGGERTRPLVQRSSDCLKLIMRVMNWIIAILPLAVFGILAKAVGTSGLGIFSVIGIFVVIVILGLGLHVFAYYSCLIRFGTRKSPVDFFKQGSPALLTALGTGSSVATLPVTLQTLHEMSVTPGSARLSACVGTNLNHDGILLYEAAAALFAAQAFGIPLGIEAKAGILLSSALAAIGIAGVPDAGLITLSLVLSSANLPLSILPLLVPVDWLLGRLRAATNVASDMVVALLLDRIEHLR